MKACNFSIKRILQAIILLIFITQGSLALAAERLALVIGNGDYSSSPLKNPINDAKDIASTLSRYGFSVTHLTNENQRSMESEIRQFTRQLDEDTVGLFYFAGHAVQVEGQNYLIPIDAQIEAQEDVRYEAVPLGRIVDGMKNSRGRLNLVILDACRNNPYSSNFRSSSTGLARSSPATGTMIMYATEPGAVAADGADRNGVFTGAFLEAIEDNDDADIETLFKKTSAKVNLKTNGKQAPWSEGIIYGNFSFAKNNLQAVTQIADDSPEQGTIPSTANEPEATEFRTAQAASSNIDALMWQSAERNGGLEAYKAYAEAFPNGVFIKLAEITIRRLEAEQLKLKQEQERLVEQERLRQEEQQRLADIELRKQQEEIARLAEEEKRKLAELERQAEQERIKEEEQRRLAEIEKRKQQEEAVRLAEEKKRKRAELERLAEQERVKQLELQRQQAEENRQKELERAAREKAEQLALEREQVEQAEKQAAARLAEKIKAEKQQQLDDANKARAASAEEAAKQLEILALKNRESSIGLVSADRVQVQLILNAQGIYVGSADGRWGKRTRAGIRQWQAKKGYVESGYLDELTHKALLAEYTASSSAPNTNTKSSELEREPEMVVIPAGTFTMGTKKWTGNARPARVVSIARFELSKFEITFEQFDEYVKDARLVPPDDRDWGRGDRPVINVSWEEANAYVAWLSDKTGKAYRLPSEAEWEYAARAGTTTSFSFSNSSKTLCEYGNSKNVSCDGFKFTAPVGTFKPNPFGLYDMHGNVGEWVEDCWHPNYKNAPVTGEPWIENGRCGTRVLRGGAWSNSSDNLRSFSRIGYTAITRISSGGFRIARSL